jgi:hypothetical protein
VDRLASSVSRCLFNVYWGHQHLACAPGFVSYITNTYGSDDLWFSIQHLPGTLADQRQSSSNDIPSLFRIESEIIHFTNAVRENPISGDKISGIDRAAVTKRQRPVFDYGIDSSPCAAAPLLTICSSSHLEDSILHDSDTISRPQEATLIFDRKISSDNARTGPICNVCLGKPGLSNRPVKRGGCRAHHYELPWPALQPRADH